MDGLSLMAGITLGIVLNARPALAVPYGDGWDVVYAKRLWRSLRGRHLVEDALKRRGLTPVSEGWHQPLRAKVSVDGTPGWVLIAPHYRPPQSADGGTLASVTVLYQHGPMPAQTGGWFWAEFRPNGTLRRDGHDIAFAGPLEAARGVCPKCSTLVAEVRRAAHSR